MTNFEETKLKEFEKKWFIDRMSKPFLHIDDVKELLDDLLAQQREEIVKEILNTFDRVQEDIGKEGFDYEPHYYGIVQDFLDSLTSSVPEEKGDTT